MTPKLKKIIIVIVIIAIGYFAYSMFFKKAEDPMSFITNTNSLNTTRNLADTQALGNQITQALVQIESLTLDKSVFDNPIFRSLDDKSEVISSEPLGRRNPFAPLTDTSVNFDPNSPSITTIENESATSSAEEGNEDEVNVSGEELPLGNMGL
jgi:hypothetical protein